jgi:hypothetical protein
LIAQDSQAPSGVLPPQQFGKELGVAIFVYLVRYDDKFMVDGDLSILNIFLSRHGRA